MSRVYRIRVSESLSTTIHVEDGVCSTLEMLEVLPREQMTEILAQELEGRGFTRKDGVCTRVEEDGTEVSVELDNRVVKVGVSSDKELNLKAEKDSSVYEEQNRTAAEDKIRDGLQEQLRKTAATKEADLAAAVTKQLEKKLGDIQKEINQVSSQATIKALKQKAATLGEIEEMTEGQDGSLTIRVRV